MFKVFLEALDFVQVDEEVCFSRISVRNSSRLPQAKTQAIAGFKELVVKLNESAFKPLFCRLYDWAFVEKPGALPNPTDFLEFRKRSIQHS